MAGEWLSAHTLAVAALALAGGFALACANLAALAANVHLYLSHGSVWRPIALHAARVAVVVSGFTVAATFGAGALLASLAGFTVARALVLGRRP